MASGLRIFLIIFSVCWLVLVSYFLKKGKLPVKYSLIWYAMILLLLILGIFPGLLIAVSKFLHFEVVSSFVVGVILTLLMIITIVLTTIIADQRKKITLLFQEVSLLKKEIKK